jgi:peptidoglycan-associated lipoprotein
MRRFLVLAAIALAGPAAAQVRVPPIIQRVIPGTRPQPVPPPGPATVSIPALRADMIAHAGSDLVYFSGDSAMLGPQARLTLTAQAQWLLQHPWVTARIEGHADLSDTRDHALAVGARRAEEVRAFLILLGVPAAQVSALSWGKERPGPARTVTVLVP